MPGKPANMHLVDDGLCERPPQRCIALPVVSAWVDHHAPQRGGGVVPRVPSSLPAATRRPGDAFPVRVEQQLVGVETKPPRRIERPGDAVAIDLARRDVGHKGVPIMVGEVRTSRSITREAFAASAPSNSSSWAAVLCLANTLKLVPPGTSVAPSGKLLPRWRQRPGAQSVFSSCKCQNIPGSRWCA